MIGVWYTSFMRKIITTTFVTLDGVMQAPGGSEEDKTGGFAYGGWQTSFPSDEMMDSMLSEFMHTPFELLLGKNTYDIFAAYWPNAKTDLEVANPFNKTKKYVVSHKSFEPSWHNSACITGDVVTQLKRLKTRDNADLWVWGSGNLIQTLLKEHLIDRMHLWIYPITIGTGKRLFAEGTQLEGFKLVGSKISKTGVILATYEPAGPLRVGSLK
jgi:dihydrofolate reductase